MGILSWLADAFRSTAEELVAQSGAAPVKHEEKKEIAPRPITQEDMEQFQMMPFILNCPVAYNPKSAPSAIMDLNEQNRKIAVEQLKEINKFILESPSLSPEIPENITIPFEGLIFSKLGDSPEYTRIVCTPYTASGKISKHPLYLQFQTIHGLYYDESQEQMNSYNSAHGKLYYGRDGSMLKASVYIWFDMKGYFYTFKTVGKTFLLSEVKLSSPDILDSPHTIYKFEI